MHRTSVECKYLQEHFLNLATHTLFRPGDGVARLDGDYSPVAFPLILLPATAPAAADCPRAEEGLVITLSDDDEEEALGPTRKKARPSPGGGGAGAAAPAPVAAAGAVSAEEEALFKAVSAYIRGTHNPGSGLVGLNHLLRRLDDIARRFALRHAEDVQKVYYDAKALLDSFRACGRPQLFWEAGEDADAAEARLLAASDAARLYNEQQTAAIETFTGGPWPWASAREEAAARSGAAVFDALRPVLAGSLAAATNELMAGVVSAFDAVVRKIRADGVQNHEAAAAQAFRAAAERAAKARWRRRLAPLPKRRGRSPSPSIPRSARSATRCGARSRRRPGLPPMMMAPPPPLRPGLRLSPLTGCAGTSALTRRCGR